MVNSAKNENLLKHIVEHCKKISALQERFGKDISIFRADFAYYDSVFMNLLQIGELANHLSREFCDKHKNIPWRQVIDLRNVIVHGYGTVKIGLLWRTVCDEVPKLHLQIIEILLEMGESGQA